jgi:methionyl-tRNA formyltransferase
VPKIVFFGSDRYSLLVLQRLLSSPDLTVSGIVTLPQSDPIVSFSKGKRYHFFITDSLIRITDSLKKIEAEVGILASYGQIVPPEVLSIFPKGILNIHPSLLPKYRGPSPVPLALLDGLTETGVTIIKMDNEVDHGPIVAQFKEEIRVDDTSETLLIRLFQTGIEILKTVLPPYLNGQITLQPQNDSEATYTKKLSRQDGQIDWQKPTEYLERFVRAMDPWPGAWTKVKILRDKEAKILRLKIIKAHLENNQLVPDQVQLEGKNPVTYKQFQEGHPTAEIAGVQHVSS